MLILPHADGLGVNLHQLCQGILKPPGNGDGRAQVYIILREFLCRQRGCGVDGGAGLVDNHIAGLGEAAEQLDGHGLGLPGGGAVSDGDVPDSVLAHQCRKGGNGLLLFLFTEGGIDHGGCQHLSGGVNHRHLAAVAVSGIQSHGDKALYGRLHQQRLQIQGKVSDCPGVSPFRQLIANLTLNGGEDQTLIGILGSGAHKGTDLCSGLQGAAANQCGAVAARKGHIGLQNLFLFSPIHGQNLMIQQAADGLGKIVVQAVNAVFLCIRGGFAGEHTLAQHQLPQSLADVGIVGKILGDDVVSPLQGILQSFHALLRVHIVLCQSGRIGAVLSENRLGKGSQPLFPGNGAPGAALLLVGAVQILHLRHGGGGIDGIGKLRCQLPLILDGLLYLIPAGLKITQIGQPRLKIPQGGVIHGPVHLLAVTGDKGNGVAFVDEPDDVFHIFLFLSQLLRQDLCNGKHNFLLDCEIRSLSYHTFPGMAKRKIRKGRGVQFRVAF